MTPSSGLARDTVVVTSCTLISRATGFARVLVAAAVLSNGPLGDAYHSANLVPNLVFDLVAGGVLQAVLVPTFVAARRSGGDAELGRIAGVVVGVLTVALGAIALLAMILAPVITWVLTALDDDALLVTDKRELMTPMLVVFIPQIIFYGLGMVSTAALAARGRFATAALAPAANNAVVIVCYVAFDINRNGGPASLDLTTWQFTLLAGGTTLAVVAFTTVPGIVLARQGVPWRPRWSPRDPAVVALRGAVGWATLSVAGTLVPTAAAVVIGSGAPGGVAVYAMAFAFFVLPHALISIPVATAVAPRIADAWQRGQRIEAGALVERSFRYALALLAVAAAAMAALSWPIARFASFGQATSQGIAPIAHALAVFGAGLVGYGIAFVMSRVLFSVGDLRHVAVVVGVSSVIGVIAMAMCAWQIEGTERAAALAIGFGVSQVLAAVVLTRRVQVVLGAPSGAVTARLGIGSLAAAAVSGVAMLIVQRPFDHGRAGSVAAIVVAGSFGLVLFAALVAPLAGVGRATLLRRGGSGVD